MAAEYELTLPDYLSIMRRRAPYLIGIFVAVLLASIIVAIVLPPTYLATGTIMVESAQVPSAVVPTTVQNQLDERINVIKQRVLTRDSLLRIANKYDLFKDRARFLTSSELIDRMRDRVGVELIDSDSVQNNRQSKQTIAFTLSFEDRRPEIAYQVASDLVALFLDWNVKIRTEGATDTAIFLAQESDRLRAEVERLEGLISDYKRQNSNALPEQLTLRMTMMSRAENDLREVERDYNSTQDELNSLQTELSAAEYGMGNDPSQSLPELKAELTRLSAIYTDSHPDIKALKRKIEAMEKVDESANAESAPDKAPTLAIYKIQSKIDSANARLASLDKQQKMLRDKIAQNERAMIMTPKVEQELDVLIRDRDTAQKKYEEILDKKMNAKIAENLESENKSERFSVLEPPIMPEKSYKPNRPKIIVLGFFLAIASSAGMLMGLVTFDNQVRGADALAHVLGYRPLAVIPYLVIREEEVRRKRMLMMVIVVSLLSMVVVAAALNYLYMPLGELFTKIMARLI